MSEESDKLVVINADVLTGLAQLESESVRCVVTSPPYWGLRNYGVPGQIGLEASPEEFVARMVEVFREVRRVLADDGTVWLNLGDSYAHGGCGARDSKRWPKQSRNDHQPKHAKKAAGFKLKELIGIPWRVAFALQQDGWYLRQDIIWHKPNPMPESVRDRCTKAHEYIFLLTKSPRYYFNATAIKTPLKPKTLTVKTTPRKGSGVESTGEKLNEWMSRNGGRVLPTAANKRSVWSISARPYKGTHFAVFPEALVEPCILAGSAPGDLVLDPFGGSGTTAAVALKHGRRAVLIELNPEYCELARQRVAGG